MTHDPLCTAFLREFLAYPEIDGPEPDEFLCLICDLLAKVREDERTCGCKFWRGYAAALRDAVEVVKALIRRGGSEERIYRASDALAAIEALRGDSN